MDRSSQNRQPLLHSRVPLRACLLSGGESRRMGRDKALLPHPEGGTWLERTLQLLGALEVPITLLSRHPEHLQLARLQNTPLLEAIAEPPPWEGPLLALHRLMERYPDQRLLLCPVDMPELSLTALQGLRRQADAAPTAIHLAQGGPQLQPLLAVLPASAALRRHLAAAVAGGERRLQSWLQQHPCRCVPLDPRALLNCNRPADLHRATASPAPAPAPA